MQVKREYDEHYTLSKTKKAIKGDDPIIIENCHEPIIDKDTFLRAREIMKKKNKQQTVSNRAKYPLTGISFCVKCGGAIICQIKNSFWVGKNRVYGTIVVQPLTIMVSVNVIKKG